MTRTFAAVLLLLSFACAESTPGPDPAVVRAADLDTLVREIEIRHPEPFGAVDEAAWRRDVADVRTRAAELSDDEFRVAVARLANLGDRNGHGGVFPTDQPGLTMWPVRLYEFADGWYVLDAADRTLVGARVTGVAGRPVADVARLLAPAVPRDNAHSLRARLASYLVAPAFLRGVGAYGPLTVTDAAGTTRDVLPAEVPAAEYATLAGLDVPQIPPGLPRPAWAPPDEWFWLRARGDALVVGYERVADEAPDGGRVGRLIAEVEEALRTRRPRVLVVDVRRNPGGNVGAARPLVILLRDVARAGRVPVRVLVSRATYSAAAVAFLELRAEAPSVRFYGEPSGGGARAYGNPGSVTLPHSGIVVQVAGGGVTAHAPDRAAIEPDVAVDLTWRAYRAGADPVLAAAVAR